MRGDRLEAHRLRRSRRRRRSGPRSRSTRSRGLRSPPQRRAARRSSCSAARCAPRTSSPSPPMAPTSGMTSAASSSRWSRSSRSSTWRYDRLGAGGLVARGACRRPRAGVRRRRWRAARRAPGRCASARRRTSASVSPQHTTSATEVRSDAGSRLDRLRTPRAHGRRAGRRRRAAGTGRLNSGRVARRECRGALGAVAADDDRRVGLLHGLRQRGGVVRARSAPVNEKRLAARVSSTGR